MRLNHIKRIRLKPFRTNTKRMKKHKEQFVALDIETTGSHALNDEIYEIGMVKVIEGKVVKETKLLILESLTENIIRRRGFNETDFNKGVDYQKAMESVEKFTRRFPIVAHNYSFDKRFIDYKYSKYMGEDFNRVWLCTMALTKKKHPLLPEYNLDYLSRKFGIINKNHHNALNDARVCADILLTLTDRKPSATIESKTSKVFRSISKFFMLFTKKEF